MMQSSEFSFGVSTADAEGVELRMIGADLLLVFTDWQEIRREVAFHGVLGFRWQEFDDRELGAIRDDASYEVAGSPWLERQASLQGERVARFAHYVLCFNQVGVLEVLARRHDTAGAAGNGALT